MITWIDADYPYHQYIPVNMGIIADRIDSRQAAVGNKKNEVGETGAVVDSTGESRITIFWDDDILSAFREQTAQSG